MHIDVKKLGNIPDGGGWRYVGRLQGERNRAATPGKPRNQYSSPKLGYTQCDSCVAKGGELTLARAVNLRSRNCLAGVPSISTGALEAFPARPRGNGCRFVRAEVFGIGSRFRY